MTAKRSPLTRQPLTKEELRRMGANELLSLKLSDEELERLREVNKELEQERIQRAIRLKVEEEPILAELRGIGLSVQSVWDLVNTKMPYPEAIPILLKHLPRPYSDAVREGIARALAVPVREVQEAWALIAEEYRKAPMGRGFRVRGDEREYNLTAKHGLACTLAAAVTDGTLPELISLAKDRTLGESRVLLLAALKRRRRKSAVAGMAIDELSRDPDLKEEIASWRKR